jgi:hypothetical protein
MPDREDIADLQFLNLAAQEELEKRIRDYRRDLLQEAARLEAVQRLDSRDPEIVSTMVADADLMLRRAYRRPPRSKLVVTAHLGSYAVAVVIGILTNHLDQGPAQVAFPIVFAIGAILAVISLTRE